MRKKKKNTKAQVSMELVLIFSFVLVIFIAFMGLITQQFTEASEKKEYKEMAILAENIKNEVMIASQVYNNYLRKFEIPYTINQRPYTILLEKDVLSINTSDKEYILILPFEVKGSFSDEVGSFSRSMDPDTLVHCITKSISDGVRISKNQVSIELNITDTNENGIPDVKIGEHFLAYVRINCVEGIKGFGVTLRYNNTHMKLMEEVILYQKEEGDTRKFSEYINENPFLEEIPSVPTYRFINDKLWRRDMPRKANRIQAGFLNPGKLDSGSGNLFRLKFEAIDSGNVTIEFDPTAIICDKTGTCSPLLDIKILGIDVTEKGALPPTKIPAWFEILES